MDSVMRCKNGRVYFQDKKEYVKELEQKIAALDFASSRDYSRQFSIVQKAKNFDASGDKYLALKTLSNVCFYTYEKNIEHGRPEAMDAYDLEEYRKSLFLDLATEVFHKCGYNNYKIEIEHSTFIVANRLATHIEGYFDGKGCIVKYGRRRYFLPIDKLCEIDNLQDFRVIKRVERSPWKTVVYTRRCVERNKKNDIK